ncbi:MAG: DUF3276 family protein [Chitinophagales bacterium]
MENNAGKQSGTFSRKLRAGKRRTYFFDVKNTRQGDFFITITESKKKFDSDGYESHKIFLYKEDFKKFMEALNETVNHVKTDLMPDFDFDAERPARAEQQDREIAGNAANQQMNAPVQENTEFTSTSSISDDEEMNWG